MQWNIFSWIPVIELDRSFNCAWANFSFLENLQVNIFYNIGRNVTHNEAEQKCQLESGHFVNAKYFQNARASIPLNSFIFNELRPGYLPVHSIINLLYNLTISKFLNGICLPNMLCLGFK